MLETVNAPLSTPPVIEHVAEDVGEPESVQDVSLLRKPDPDTCTGAPGLAEDGLKVIEGG
jgi:hypothetical protein